MRSTLSVLAIGVAFIGVLAFSNPAEARHRHHHHHNHVGFGFTVPLAPAYYPPPPVYYVPPAPVYRPVYEPVRAYVDDSYCREYRSNYTIDGHRQPVYGTACQQPDGTWRIIN